jgi:hypothetical protein
VARMRCRASWRCSTLLVLLALGARSVTAAEPPKTWRREVGLLFTQFPTESISRAEVEIEVPASYTVVGTPVMGEFVDLAPGVSPDVRVLSRGEKGSVIHALITLPTPVRPPHHLLRFFVDAPDPAAIWEPLGISRLGLQGPDGESFHDFDVQMLMTASAEGGESEPLP